MLRFVLSLALCLGFSSIVAAQQEVALTLFPERLPNAGETIRVVAKLTLDGKPLTEDDLKTVHTQKFHLLVVDPTLTDYQHLHPQPTATPGSYLFTFTPKLAGGYRAWADVTPMGGGQLFAMADLGEPKKATSNRKESYKAENVDGGYFPPSPDNTPVKWIPALYNFVLSLDKNPVAGKPLMATVTVTGAEDRPVKLEPVMGAFAYLVGFYDDYKTTLHAHPMGGEPATDAASNPALMFHLTPEKPGFVRLFLQVKINGQEIFAPFGITISAP